MSGLSAAMDLQLGMAISGSLDLDDFRIWVMSNMLEFESMRDDLNLMEVAFAIQNFNYVYEDGYLSRDEFRSQLRELRNTWRPRPILAALAASQTLSFGDTQSVDLTGSVEEVKQDQSGTRMIAWSEDPSITDSAIIANATSSTFTSRGIVPINWLPEKISNQIMPILSFAT